MNRLHQYATGLLCVCCLIVLNGCSSPSVEPTPGTAAMQPSSAAIPSTSLPASAESVATPVPTTITTEPSAQHVYVFPVKNDACQYSSSHHDYPATDIICPIGTEFVAVTSGVVDFVSAEDRWNPAADNPADRGGISVAIIGDDGLRYYGSHLSAIADGITPGVRVAAGQLLGQTGNSGSAHGNEPHLHFGISRPTTPDDWEARRGQIWPQTYLVAWKEGRNVTPTLN